MISCVSRASRHSYLAVGASKGAKVGCPGDELPGVMTGIDFLREVNLGEKPDIGKSVAVIGGGNVAIDVARAAVRLGAKTTIVYRRDRDAMPAADDEVEEAIAEGVKFMFLASPVEITGEGKAETLKVEVMELKAGKPVGTGKFETLPISAVISAIGQKIDLNGMDFATGAKGTVNVSMPSYQTSVADVFAGRRRCHRSEVCHRRYRGRQGGRDLHPPLCASRPVAGHRPRPDAIIRQ